MSNFGVFDLRLVDAYRPSLEEARSAVGAGDVVTGAREFASVGDAIADAEVVVGTTGSQSLRMRHRLFRLEAAAVELRRVPGRIAILFGSEKYGLGVDDLAYCHWLLRIPTRDEHASMNLGQAVAVALYELARDGEAAGPSLDHRATQQQLERFETLLLDALAESGYAGTPSTVEKVRRLIRRLEIPPHDAVVWQGMLRQILWKLRHNRNRDDQSTDAVSAEPSAG